MSFQPGKVALLGLIIMFVAFFLPPLPFAVTYAIGSIITSAAVARKVWR